ncbi:MAG: FtsK/SpoIIIE domain-containing protein, partial [Pyrinomonadaceae bacterium]
LCPVVTEPHKAVSALNWAVREMEERYKRMSKLAVRNIDVYNNRVRNAQKRGEQLARTVQTGFDNATGQAIYEQEAMALETMPYIVIVVDEFADLMIVAGKEIEAAVQRLAQMARAAGIHLIMATQRPSVDIVTGTIKANFPTRIGFKVASRIDSRTILNEQGAEQLLGQGDMLFMQGGGRITRIHGPFVSDEEVERIFLTGLEKMHPNFRRQDVLAFKVSRVRQVFPLPVLNYSRELADMKTSIDGVYIVNSSHIVNGTLNVNETVQLAENFFSHEFHE